MKTSLSVALVFWIGHIALAHEIVVHKAITEHAAASALDYSSGYTSFVDVVSPDCAYETAVASMVNGSAFEDNFRKEVSGAPDEGGMRSLNHFYDPLTGLGLSNIPLDDRFRNLITGQFIPVGKDSFTWASTRDCPGIDIRVNGIGVNVNTRNVWSWKNARDHEWLGLTAATRASRQAALLDMFRAVGQVVHLLEDASQPEHTRNEQHLFPGSPIENYGGKHLASLNYQHGMLDWRNAGFTKLEDFWNRHLYNGSDPQALVDDAKVSQPQPVGLAEFSNGNFLGARHLYPEYFTPGKVAYYPFPSRDTSTNYKQVKAKPATGIDTYTLKDGHQGMGIYIKKNAGGVTVNHHSRINYLGAKKLSGLTGRAFCTISDPNVLFDYHDTLIPKAIKYSAGILDYFFRGRIEIVNAAWHSSSPAHYTITVRNKSGESFKDGTFSMYKDDGNGNRSIVGSAYTYNSTLADNATLDIDFASSQITDLAKCLLVYKGTIGVDGNNAANDSVDSGIAIAAKKFTLNGFHWAIIDLNGGVGTTYNLDGINLVTTPTFEGDYPDGYTFSMTGPVGWPGFNINVTMSAYYDGPPAALTYGFTQTPITGDSDGYAILYVNDVEIVNFYLPTTGTAENPTFSVEPGDVIRIEFGMARYDENSSSYSSSVVVSEAP